MSKKFANKLEIKKVWTQAKGGAQALLENGNKFYSICYPCSDYIRFNIARCNSSQNRDGYKPRPITLNFYL